MLCSCRFDFLIKFHPDRWENEFTLLSCSQEWEGVFYNKPVGVGEGITAGGKEEESCMHK